MAKTWYPIINYVLCEECGVCSGFCPHGVYDMQKAPTPIVTNPDGCIDHCHGCGNICPVGAITYAGDDTDWVPPHGKVSEKSACCASGQCDCGCNCSAESTMPKES